MIVIQNWFKILKCLFIFINFSALLNSLFCWSSHLSFVSNSGWSSWKTLHIWIHWRKEREKFGMGVTIILRSIWCEKRRSSKEISIHKCWSVFLEKTVPIFIFTRYQSVINKWFDVRTKIISSVKWIIATKKVVIITKW